MGPCLIIAILFLVVFAALSAFGQTVPEAPDAEVTDVEKTEIRQFTLEFLGELKKTRAARPLLAKYFARDFDVFLNDYFLYDSDTKGRLKAEPRGRAERKRMAIAMLNAMAVISPIMVVHDLEKHLPKLLRQDYRNLTGDEQPSQQTRRGRLRYIKSIEKLDRDFARYWRAHPIENNRQYIEAVRKREKIDDYNYSILPDVPETDSDEPAAKWLRSHPGAKTYLVGTPLGLCVGVMSTKGKYKVIYLMPWPISYDSRLGN